VRRDAERWDGYVDWRNRPATRGRHGGMLAASFVLGKRSIVRFDDTHSRHTPRSSRFFQILLELAPSARACVPPPPPPIAPGPRRRQGT
jgi:hypothetical protein